MMCVVPRQVPELFGPIRTIAEGRGETVLIGTTKHFVLQGSLDGDFMPITQVDRATNTAASNYNCCLLINYLVHQMSEDLSGKRSIKSVSDTS